MRHGTHELTFQTCRTQCHKRMVENREPVFIDSLCRAYVFGLEVSNMGEHEISTFAHVDHWYTGTKTNVPNVLS
jgi:Iap family predicted aminopeptidase